MSTVKVRIAVAVDANGNWNSCGWANGKDAEKMELCVESLEDGEARYWIETELSVPQVPVFTVKAVPVE